MLDSRAKALCESAKRALPDNRKSAGDDVERNDGAEYRDGPGQGNQETGGFATSRPLLPPAPGLHRYDLAKGGLALDLPASYPQGYGPAWKLNTNIPQPIIMQRYNRLNHGPQGTETLFVRIVDDQGRTALEFFRRSMLPCLADIVGLPQVLSEEPKRFRLANFRFANNQGPQCQRRLGSRAPWDGTLTLSADGEGNIRLSLVMDLAMDSGAPWFEFTARDLPFDNQMTPQMATAEIQRKAQIALAEKQRAEEARKVMAARLEQRRKLTGLARLADQTIDEDSRAWLASRYDIGSVANAKAIAWSKDHVPEVVRADYTYNNGQRGAVKITLRHNQSVSCVQFWNESKCRPLGQPESHSIAAGFLAGMFSGQDTSSGGSRDGQNCQSVPAPDGNGNYTGQQTVVCTKGGW